LILTDGHAKIVTVPSYAGEISASSKEEIMLQKTMTWDHEGPFEIEFMEGKMPDLKPISSADMVEIHGSVLKVHRGKLSRWLTGFRVCICGGHDPVAIVRENTVYAIRDEQGELLWTGVNFIICKN
jgi:hypothetical protein